jgi:hypothetical protein
MYTKAIRTQVIKNYSCAKWALSSTLLKCLSRYVDFLRFQYPYDYSKPTVRTDYPGPKHQEAIETVQSYNLDQAYQVKNHSTHNSSSVDSQIY